MNHEVARQPEAHEIQPVEIEPRPLPEGFREPDDRQPVRPYEPTPAALNMNLNPYWDEVLPHQRLVDEALGSLFAEYAPDDIPSSVKHMVHLDYMAGNVQRTVKNMHSYAAWKDSEDAMRPEVKAVERKLLLGTIEPDENLRLMQGSTLMSSELAKVTHPYRYRMGYVSEARNKVADAIEQHGGVMYPRIISPYRKIDLQPNVTHDEAKRCFILNGFLVTYKRDVGHILRNDGRRIYITERQSAAIRVDSGVQDLDKDIASILRKHSPNEAYQPWVRHINEKVYPYFEDHIQSDTTADFFIPLSTMTYAAAETDEEFTRRTEEERAHGRGNPVIQRALGSKSILYVNRGDSSDTTGRPE